MDATAEVPQEESVSTKTTTSTKKKSRKTKTEPLNLLSMYVLKFNSPILPYAKFPLTHNRYI